MPRRRSSLPKLGALLILCASGCSGTGTSPTLDAHTPELSGTELGARDGGSPSREAPARDGSPSDAPRPDALKPDLGPVVHLCAKTALSGSTLIQKYDSFFDARGRPQRDQEMGWVHDPKLADLINTVRFGDPPSSLASDLEKLRTAVDFIPEHHGQTSLDNYTLFKTQGLTDSPDAYAKFNSRDYIPAALTRYGYQIMAERFVNWADHPWTRLALARCPDCIDGIVTLSGVPDDRYQKHHDFFRVIEVRFVTDRAVYAATAAERMKNGDGRLFVSKPLKLLAAIDSSGSVYTHITTKASTFFTPPLNQIKIRYRGEIGDPLYNVIQSGEIGVKSPYRTGMVALLMRYASVNDLSVEQVCDPTPIPAGTSLQNLCSLMEWGTWRCGPFGTGGKEVDQVCKQQSSLTGFKWLVNSFVSCASCKIDPLKGCTYGP